VLGVAIFGLTLPATRLAVAGFEPLFVTLGRSLVAAALAGLTLLWARPPLPPRRDWPRLAAFALFAIGALQWADLLLAAAAVAAAMPTPSAARWPAVSAADR